MCDEFYLTLVSNNLTDENNTIASFNTILPRRMEFDSSWRVGLSDISFTKSWFNVRSDALISLVDEDVLDGGRIVFYGSEARIKAGYYATELELSLTINKMLQDVNKAIPLKKEPSVEFDRVSRRVIVVPGIMENGGFPVIPFLDLQLANMLGLEIYNHPDISIKGGWKSIRAYDLNAGIHSVFVYCDLITPSFVGDSFSQVIRSVAIPETPFGQECVIHYNPVQYHKLNRNFFDRIEIQLVDDSGELIPFEFGRSKLTLHFKRDG